MDTSRIHGIDVARGLAMLGMVIAHFVWADDDSGLAAVLARSVDGRAMPLFMLLGGIGVVLVSRRSPHPDRGLVIRAGILLVIGLLLDATDTWVAVVLQFYGFLFLLAPLLRRLSTAVLAASAAVSVAVGAWSVQVIGQPRQLTSFDAVGDGWPGLRSLIFDGYYPFFPVFGFFALGMVLARSGLRSDRLAGALVGAGVVIGVGTVWAADLLASALDVDPLSGAGTGQFHAGRLLDVSGHSGMPAWAISAAGTSVALLGASLLAARRWSTVVRPLAVMGTVALSFYVFQVLATLWVARPSTTSLAREWLTVAVLYVGFLALAAAWKLRFRSGPLEALLRVGSGRPRSVVRWSDQPPRQRPEAPAPRRPSVGTPPR